MKLTATVVFSYPVSFEIDQEIVNKAILLGDKEAQKLVNAAASAAAEGVMSSEEPFVKDFAPHHA